MMSEEGESLVRLVFMTMALFIVVGAFILVCSISRGKIIDSNQYLKEIHDEATTEVADTAAEENTLKAQILEIIKNVEATQEVSTTESTVNKTSFSKSFKSLIDKVGKLLDVPAYIVAIIACSISIGFGVLYLICLHRVDTMYVNDLVITDIIRQTRTCGDVSLYAFAITMISIAIIFL